MSLATNIRFIVPPTPDPCKNCCNTVCTLMSPQWPTTPSLITVIDQNGNVSEVVYGYTFPITGVIPVTTQKSSKPSVTGQCKPYTIHIDAGNYAVTFSDFTKLLTPSGAPKYPGGVPISVSVLMGSTIVFSASYAVAILGGGFTVAESFLNVPLPTLPITLTHAITGPGAPFLQYGNPPVALELNHWQ